MDWLVEANVSEDRTAPIHKVEYKSGQKLNKRIALTRFDEYINETISTHVVLLVYLPTFLKVQIIQFRMG